VLSNLPSVTQTLPEAEVSNSTPALPTPTCNVVQKTMCTASGVDSTIDNFCNRFVGDAKTLDAGSQLVGESYNFGEGYGLVGTFTVLATGITLTREACAETLKLIQEGCVRNGAQCASGQVTTTDGNIIASIAFS
jgi:hypothetical protein